MSRLKLLAAAMLLALPIISACGETPPPPPPTGSIDGLVSIEGQGIDGVSVTLSNGATVTTANGGMFRFDGVEAGAYTVTISNYPDDASFNQTSAAATIATDGENVTVNFPGDWIRTSAIMGTVTVENEGLGGVTVTLSGMSDSETLTHPNGQYAFSGLRAGTYTVQISGFDEEDVAFGSTQKSPTVAVGESKVETFEGTYLRASAITGQVTVGDNNNPLEGVTVSLQGKGEDRTATTNGAGQYTFSELRRGDYSVGITNPDVDEYSFEFTSRNVTVAHGETGTLDFNGILLRTATILGTVTVDGVGGIEGVTVTIQGGERGQEHIETTNAAGQFRFTDLYAGDYSVGISGFDDDLYGFDVTTGTVTVERKATATVKPFEGIELRTAGIEGTITVDGGHPLPGVTVTVTGGPKDEEHTRVTNDAGYYMVDELHAGVYTVAITDYDENEYEFEATTRTIDVGLRTTATVAFQGDLLRTGGISGRVSVGGMGLDGITVTLSGDADDEMMTADGGQYAFTGLAEGDYAVEIEGWDDDLYAFETAMMERHVAQDASEIVNFDGTHRENNTISGSLFLDEIDVNMMQDQGEPAFAQAGIPLILQGPGVNEVRYGASMPDGSYAFPDLVAGSYRVLINMTEEAATALTEAGFRFSGELTGEVANVSAGEGATVNFPFRIVMQTIHVGAVMGTSEMATETKVGGVELTLYPTVEDADNGTNALGTAKTGVDDTKPDYGMAKFDFPRAMDLGPGGQGMDHLVFAKVVGTGNAALEVADNAHIEIEYAGTDRVSGAPAAARLLNTAVSFKWQVKSNADAEDGDQPLSGWKSLVDGMLVGMGEGDDFEADTTGMDGMASYSGSVAIADLNDDAQKEYTIKLDADDPDATPAHDAMQPDGGENWTQSAALTHTHNALMLPGAGDDADPEAIYVTWTTQTLVVGVYREMDDVPGYIGHISHREEDDARPNARVAAEMEFQVLHRNDRGHLVPYEWDHDNDPETDPGQPANLSPNADGLLKVKYLPATKEVIVGLNVGTNRTLVSNLGYAYVEAFGATVEGDNALGSNLGAFGAAGGAGPEMRLCTASIGTSYKDEDCASYAYQWTTSKVVGDTDPNTNNVDVTIAAVTKNHGASSTDGTKTTPTAGSVTFAVQDGTFDLTAASKNLDWTIDDETPAGGNRVWCYHSENADETDEPRADSAWVGRACTATRTWELTEGRLEIRGYVANVTNEHNNVVRVDETAPVELEIRKAAARGGTAAKPATTGDVLGNATVQPDGSFKFTGLAAGSYVVTAKNVPGSWEALQSDPTDNVGGRYVAERYTISIADNQSNLSGSLPQWVHNSSSMTNERFTLNNGLTGAARRTDTYFNFALLHADGLFQGRVIEATGNHAGIAVELNRCVSYTYTPDDPDTAGEDEEDFNCTVELPFGPVVERTNSSGVWTFDDLREGVYFVNADASGYRRAKWNATGIDDDAMNCDGGTVADAECHFDRTVEQYDTLKGKNAFVGRQIDYYIWNARRDSLHDATGLTATGVTTNGQDAVDLGAIDLSGLGTPHPETNDLTGTTLNPITFDARTVNVKAGLPGGSSTRARYTVMGGTLTRPAAPGVNPVTGADLGVDVPLTYNENNEDGAANIGTPPDNNIVIKVIADNGYHDTEYTINATRTNPVDNLVEAADIGIYEGTNAVANPAAVGGTNSFTWTTVAATTTSVNVVMNPEVVPGTGTGTVPVRCAQSIRVTTQGGTAVDVTRAANDNCPGRFTLTLASASNQAITYYIYMTGEDGVEARYSLTITRA